ncbi:hypothetical protein MP228_008808 [Amoeboaphelidium protococcarum]|nr:hypothetical protein MP228_008808 [Amoeboaphelidium protococcarum]
MKKRRWQNNGDDVVDLTQDTADSDIIIVSETQNQAENISGDRAKQRRMDEDYELAMALQEQMLQEQSEQQQQRLFDAPELSLMPNTYQDPMNSLFHFGDLDSEYYQRNLTPSPRRRHGLLQRWRNRHDHSHRRNRGTQSLVTPSIDRLYEESMELRLLSQMLLDDVNLLSAAFGTYNNNEPAESYEDLLELGQQIGNVQRGLTEHEVDLIPVISYTNSLEHKECSICMSKYELGDQLMILPSCLHAFHKDCIKIWLKQNRQCCICREDLGASLQQ